MESDTSLYMVIAKILTTFLNYLWSNHTSMAWPSSRKFRKSI